MPVRPRPHPPCAVRPSLRVALVLCLLSAAAAARGQGVLLDPVTRAQGSPSDYVRHLVQDRQGFFWLATDAGLVRYDGRAFVTWTTAEGLPHNYVNTLHELPDGRLVVGTYRGTAVMDRGRLSRLGSDTRSVAALAHDRFGRVYVATSDQVLACTGGRCEALPTPGHVVNELFVMEADGSLSLSLTDDQVLHLRPTAAAVRVEVVTKTRGLGEAGIDPCPGDPASAPREGQRRLVLPGGTCLQGTLDGRVWQIDPRGQRLLVGRAETEGFPVYSLMQDYEGHIWVVLFGGGVKRLDSYALQLPGLASPALARPGLRLVLDRDGTVWMSTRDGLVARRPGGEVHTVRLHEMTILQPHPGGGYVRATADTLVRIRPDGRLLPIAAENNWVSSLLVGTGDTLWSGSYGSGIRRFVGTREVGVAPGGPEIVEALLPGVRGAVWALTRSEGAYRYAHGGWTHIRAGLPSASIYSLLDEADGTLWLGTDRGLVRRRGTTQRVFDDHGLLRGQRLHALFRTTDTLWVVADRALYGVVGDSLRRFGRVRLRPDEGVAIHATLPLPAARRLMLGTSVGLVEVDLRGAGVPLPSPKVAFLGVSDASAHGTPRDTIRLSVGQRSLTLAFTPLTFGTGPGRLQHRISGGRWSEPTTDRTVALVGLSDGWHRIEVRAVNADGRTSEQPVGVVVHVPPPWWRTWVARLVALLGLVVIVGLVVRRVSTQRLRARLRALETERRVQSERDRISRDLHDHVGSQLTGVLAGLDLLGDEAPASRPLVGALRDEVRDTMGALRTTLLTLQHPPDTFDALGALLCRYVRDQTRFRTTPTLRCAVDGTDDRKIDPYAALHVFHVAQEALQNAVRHAGASAVDVHLATNGHAVTLTVSDDGRFRRPDGTGHGLASMEARADEIGARLTLDGTDDGTTVRLAWQPGVRIVRTDDAHAPPAVVS